MKHLFILAVALTSLFLAPTLLSAAEASAVEALAAEAPVVVAKVAKDSLGLPKLAFDTEDSCISCNCNDHLATPPVTKVGATCLKARQKAAAAARALAVCPPGSTSCGPVTHSVAPCQPITNGYSATATAYYACETCIDRCQ